MAISSSPSLTVSTGNGHRSVIALIMGYRDRPGFKGMTNSYYSPNVFKGLSYVKTFPIDIRSDSDWCSMMSFLERQNWDDTSLLLIPRAVPSRTYLEFLTLPFSDPELLPRDVLIASDALPEVDYSMSPFQHSQRVSIVTIPTSLHAQKPKGEIFDDIWQKCCQNSGTRPSLNRILAIMERYCSFKIDNGVIELSPDSAILTYQSTKILHPRQEYDALPYKQGAVFSLSWADSDLKEFPVNNVKIFEDCCRNTYKFHNFTSHVIQSPRERKPRNHTAVHQTALEALKSFLGAQGNHSENLVIFYYCGHGDWDGNDFTLWRNSRDPNHKALSFGAIWDSIQENACADTLIILDTCYAGLIQHLVEARNTLKIQSGRKIEISTSSMAGPCPVTSGYTQNLVKFMEHVALERASDGFTMSEAQNANREDMRQRSDHGGPVKDKVELAPDWFKVTNRNQPTCNIVIRPFQERRPLAPETNVKRKRPNAAYPPSERQPKRTKR